ncbi:MAG: hypothetical protein ACI814_001985 [Mariniblastus sp.]|jgi:hypothetical protein
MLMRSIATFGCVILGAAMLSSPSWAQSSYIVERESSSLETAFSHRHITFVYHQSTVGQTKAPVTDLAKLIHPSVAAKKGRPPKAHSDLLDELAGLRNHYELHSAAAIDYGDDGFFWKLEWWIYPGKSGSGPLAKYSSMIRGDGTVVHAGHISL